MDNITIQFGIFAPAINAQLAKQGLAPKEPHMGTLWDDWSNHINSLRVTGLLSEGEVDRARQRLIKRIAANVEKLP